MTGHPTQPHRSAESPDIQNNRAAANMVNKGIETPNESEGNPSVHRKTEEAPAFLLIGIGILIGWGLALLIAARHWR